MARIEKWDEVHGTQAPDERMMAFLDSTTDQYAILQLRRSEDAMLLERKKSSYAEYRKTKSEMQDWLVAQKIVQEILKEDDQKKEQLHEQEVRQEEENRQSSR